MLMKIKNQPSQVAVINSSLLKGEKIISIITEDTFNNDFSFIAGGHTDVHFYAANERRSEMVKLSAHSAVLFGKNLKNVKRIFDNYRENEGKQIKEVFYLIKG